MQWFQTWGSGPAKESQNESERGFEMRRNYAVLFLFYNCSQMLLPCEIHKSFTSSGLKTMKESEKRTSLFTWVMNRHCLPIK